MRRLEIINRIRKRQTSLPGCQLHGNVVQIQTPVQGDTDRWEGYELICGYCLLPTTPEASVRIGSTDVPLCHDTDTSCYELVTVYGRPLADGRRVGHFTKSSGQLSLPTLEILPSEVCHHTVAEGCRGHGDF